MENTTALSEEQKAENDQISQQIAADILTQLGGNKFRAATGASNMVRYDNGISFRIPGGGGFARDGINFVKITVNSLDLYDVEYGKIRGSKYKVIRTDEGIYDDMLQPCFTKATGLVTGL